MVRHWKGEGVMMDGSNEFHNAQTGSKMTTCHRDGIDHLQTQFIGNLWQLFVAQPVQIGRI